VDNPAPLNNPIDGPMITARQVISSWSMPKGRDHVRQADLSGVSAVDERFGIVINLESFLTTWALLSTNPQSLPNFSH